MGLWDTLTTHAKSQFLAVIEWLDDSNDTIVYRPKVFQEKITDQSKLVVREGQAAVFVSEGVSSDVFGPGTYTLDTRNGPITSFFSSIKYALNYPYKGEVYFIDTTLFRENRWGTPNPFMMRDAEFGPVRVRAFGTYDFRVTDPGLFLKQIVGTDQLFTTREITGDLKKKLVSAVAAAINAAKIPVLDLAAAHGSLGDKIRAEMNPGFQSTYGITITNLNIENISLPEAVEQALDTRSKMGILGNIDQYAKMQAADAIQIAAANEGLAGASIGMGVGFGMGNMMGNVMGGQAMGARNPPSAGPSAGPPPPPQAALFHYNGPSGQSQGSAAEIAQKVASERSANHLIWMAGWSGWKPWDQVPQITQLVPPAPVAPPPVPQSLHFHYNGPSGQSEQSLAQVVALIQADATGPHNLWMAGWPAWRSASEVPEVQRALAQAAPPEPPPL